MQSSSRENRMLQLGSTAPDFVLPDAEMEMVKLSQFRGKNVVLYFYPKDDTPGCTVEAIEFSDLDEVFARYNTIVMGVSKDDCISHGEFRDKHGLAINLLSDQEGKVCERYKAWQEKEKDGIKKMGIVRSTFIIDAQGILRHMQYGVTPKGHAQEILTIIKQLHTTT